MAQNANITLSQGRSKEYVNNDMRFYFVVLAALTAVASALPAPEAAPVDMIAANLLAGRSNCGTTNGPCSSNGCQGINKQDGSPGVCTAGKFIGCPCASLQQFDQLLRHQSMYWP